MPFGDLRHGRDERDRLDLAAPVERVDALGDVLGIVADTLDHARDLERGDDVAKVVGHGRAQGDGAHRQPIHFGFQRIEPGIAGDDRLRQFLIVVDERLDGVADRDFGEPAHLGDEPTKLVISESKALTVWSTMAFPLQAGRQP
jgi:hypothetical protein